MKIVLCSDDINLLSYWEKTFNFKYDIVDDLEDLEKISKSIIIINYTAFNSDAKHIIKMLDENSNLVFVLHRVPDIKTAREVLSYGAKAYGNALMKEYFITYAIETIQDGLIWLHPEFTSQLITQIPSKKSDLTNILDVLSDREEEVALLLKDGDSYKTVATKLSITPRTVKAHAQSLYAKLHVKDRISLALLLK